MRVQFFPIGCLSDEEIDANVAASAARNLPHIRGCGRLALVGGGPSAKSELHTLRAWKGEIWGINGAASWLADQSIACSFVTMHPMVENISPRIRRAILGKECSPALYDALADRDVYVLDDKTASGQQMPRGCTTATAVALMHQLIGFADVTFFGLEGSYGETSHNYEVYQDPTEHWVVVQAHGETFRTKAEFLLQSQYLAELIYSNPIYEEYSGGLLRALVNDHLYEVIDAAPDLLDQIERELNLGNQSSDDNSQRAS